MLNYDVKGPSTSACISIKMKGSFEILSFRNACTNFNSLSAFQPVTLSLQSCVKHTTNPPFHSRRRLIDLVCVTCWISSNPRREINLKPVAPTLFTGLCGKGKGNKKSMEVVKHLKKDYLKWIFFFRQRILSIQWLISGWIACFRL